MSTRSSSPASATRRRLGAFLILQDAICILALVITRIFKIEPAGKSLDEISGRQLSGLKAQPTPP